ncbi:MAG: AAA family ATPase, partial [Saprospiraceae bacterium]
VARDFFSDLVNKLHQKFERKVVVLVDEYDKPLVDNLLEYDKFKENQSILRGLYGNIKGLDAHLEFVMLTGVSRFSKIGVFSGLNNLEDISIDDRYHSIVGFSETELAHYFPEHLTALVQKTKLPLVQLKKHIKFWYNGFSWDGEHRLYNPFSLFNLFHKRVFANYWFSTGTPTFLIDLIRVQKQIPEDFEKIRTYDLEGAAENFKEFPLIPILFQTGYLTIKRVTFDGLRPVYELSYPNDEVRHSLLSYIAGNFINKDQYKIEPEVIKLREALITENIPDFLQYLRSFFAAIPARLHLPKEAYYHSMVYMLLRLSGVQLLLEKETDKGRIDGVLELADKIYIIEFKFATSKRIKRVATLADKAIRQIEAKKYYEPYLAANKKVILLGIGFLDKAIAGKAKYFV